MSTARTGSSLGARIRDTQERAARTAADFQPTRRDDRSFAERYVGTEFATPVMMAPVQESIARGRIFLLLSLAAVGVTGAAIVSAAGA